jgi:hypothetical protein
MSGMEAIRLETTVARDGSILLTDLQAGEEVEVIVLRKGSKASFAHPGGWAKGKIRMLAGFDDPIPGINEYS